MGIMWQDTFRPSLNHVKDKVSTESFTWKSMIFMFGQICC